MRRLTRWTATFALVCVLYTPVAPAAVVTLKDGSVYNGIDVNRFEGRDRRFSVEKGETVARVRVGEIDSIEFDNAIGMVTLQDGSVYSAVNILGFDGRMDRFQVRRGDALLDVRAAEINEIDFSSSLGGGLVPVPVAVPVVPAEVTPAGVSTAEDFDEEGEINAVSPEEKARIAERLKSGAARVPIGDPSQPSEWEIAIDSPIEVAPPREVKSGRGWGDDALYSNLPEDFGKIKIAPQSKDAKPDGYVPRWKDTSSKSKSASKTKSKAANPDAGKSRTAKSAPRGRSSPRSAKSRSSRSGGGGEGESDRALANADGNDRSSSRDRRSSRSRSSSSRSGSSRDRDGGRSGSRFGFGGSGSGGGSYGGSQYGGSSSYGGGSYGGSSYGGSSYGGSSYGGGSYGGSSYGGGY